MLTSTLFALAATAVQALAMPASSSPSLDARQSSNIPKTFKWTSTKALVSPKNDGRGVAGVKDPSIVQIGNTYHVFASTAQDAGYNMFYFNFTDFNKAGDAPFFYLDKSGIGTGYRAAPEVFYFEPHKLWYLIYQNGNAAYSTNKDISNPAGWTAPVNFYPNGTPALIAEGLKKPQEGYWVDMWVVCDEVNCHLFSSDDNGRLYRSQTSLKNFPKGMSDPVIAMQEPNRGDLYEAAAIYNIAPKNKTSEYLLLVECMGAVGRYFRSWTSSKIEGPWTPLAATESNPFLGASNVVFDQGVKAWTKSISHGELIRTDLDQNLRVKPCEMRFFYQGVDPNVDVSYNSLPWKMALVTQTGSKC